MGRSRPVSTGSRRIFAGPPIHPPRLRCTARRSAPASCSALRSRGVTASETVIARGFAFIGPGLPLGEKFAVGSFLRDLLEGDSIRVLGDGTPIRSYLYAGDMSAWLWTILARGLGGRAYNVGSERAVSIAELARFTASLADPPLPVQVATRADPSAAADRYVPSTERARSELGLKETVDWQEALRRTYEWLRRKSIPEMATRTER